MEHLGTQRIETARLVLRPFCVDDAEAMYRNWASDSEVTKYLTWPPHASAEVSRAVLESWTAHYAEKNYYQWAIVLKENGGEPIGSIAAVGLNDGIEMAHVGYCIGRRWWHRGVMTEALGAVIAFFFDQVGMNRVESRHDPRNPHSGLVMQKCGMRYEGLMRSADRNNQGVCDVCLYAMLRQDAALRNS
ncbi:MAG: GNAT family N-acetyltransferase [Clostridia bacterium]|nr:GNAT family N-acetyltransferase [Clostridia bacterium]